MYHYEPVAALESPIASLAGSLASIEVGSPNMESSARNTSTARKVMYLPVEVMHRAFDSRLLLACHAAARGYAAVLGAKSKIAKLAANAPPGIVIEKSIVPEQTKTLEYLRGRGHQIVCLDEEGDGCRRRSLYQGRRLSRETTAATDTFAALGELHREVVLEAHPDLEPRTLVTGNPRIDLWSRPFREIYRDQADAIRARHGDYILLPSNFKGTRSHIRGLDFLMALGVANDPENTRRNQEYLAQHIERLDVMFDEFTALIPVLAASFPDHTILIRPHPTERAGPWREASGGLPNVVVEYDGVVTPYIMGADCLLHHGCTTGMESYFLGTPAVAYLPRFDPTFDDHPSVDLSQRAHSVEETLEKIRIALDGRHSPPESARAVLDREIAVHEDRTACTAIIDAVEMLHPAPVEFDPATFAAGHGQERGVENNRTPGLFGRLRRALGQRIGAPHADDEISELYRQRKWPGTSLEEVRRKIDGYAAVDPRFRHLESASLGEKLFCVWR